MNILEIRLLALCFAGFMALFMPTTQAPKVAGASVLTGQVLSSASQPPQPLEDAEVSITDPDSGFMRRTRTNSGGAFRFEALPGGRLLLTVQKAAYVVHTESALFDEGQRVVSVRPDRSNHITIHMAPGAVIEGALKNAFGGPAVGAAVTLFRDAPATVSGFEPKAEHTTITDDEGRYRFSGLHRGVFLVGAQFRGYSSRPTVAGDGTLVSYAPTFFPGSIEGQGAARIEVHTGGVRSGNDFALQLGTAGNVTGLVRSNSGVPMKDAQVVLVSDGSVMPPGILRSISVAPDGTFRSDGLRVGKYRLVARSEHLVGTSSFQLNGHDKADVPLILRNGIRVTGRLVSPTGANLSNYRVTIKRAAAGPSVEGIDRLSETSDAEGHFVFEGILPGDYLLEVIQAGDGAKFWAATAFLNGRDMLDEPVSLGYENDNIDLKVILRPRTTALRGTLVDAGGTPTDTHNVVLASSDARFWRIGSRRVLIALVDDEGRFEVNGIPPGDYLVAAVSGSSAEMFIRTVNQNELRANGTLVSITSEKEVVLNLALPPTRRLN